MAVNVNVCLNPPAGRSLWTRVALLLVLIVSSQLGLGANASFQQSGNCRIGVTPEPKSINPMVLTTYEEREVSRQIYEPLFELAGTGLNTTLISNLASEVITDLNSTMFTVKIDPRAIWHNGSSVTASDLQLSLEAARALGVASLDWAYISQQDALTLQLGFDQPNPTFVEDTLTRVMMMPAEIWQSVGFELWSQDPGSLGDDPPVAMK